MKKSAGYHDLRQAFTEPGCALCRLLAKQADSYIDQLLWELVNDIDGRAELNQARGFCNGHAWMLVRYGASLGVALLMDGIIGEVMRLVERDGFKPQPAFSLRQVWGAINTAQPSPATADLVKMLEPQLPCPVCKSVQKSEAYYLAALLKHLAGADSLLTAYQASDGLCLPHFRLALSRVSHEASYTALVEAQKSVWQRLRADLAEFIRKNDHRFRGEPFGAEGDAWLRGIEAVSGAPPPKQNKPGDPKK
jgi:hypothetical protein